MLERVWRKGNPLALLVGMSIDTATVENSMEIPQEITKIDLPYDPEISFLGIYLKKTGTLIHKDKSTPMFIATLFTLSKIWKQPKCPSTDE